MADQNVRARKIPEALWTLHRDEIIALYRTRELRGQDGVMDIMMRKHGFKANKAQYEYQLGSKWKIKKNFQKKQWLEAIELTAQREREGKRTIVKFGEAEIPEDRLARERARYGVSRSHAPSQSRYSSLQRGQLLSRCSSKAIASSNDMVIALSPPASPLIIDFRRIVPSTFSLTQHAVSTQSQRVYRVPPRHLFEVKLFRPFSWTTRLDWQVLTDVTSNSHALTKRVSNIVKDQKALTYNSPSIAPAHSVSTVSNTTSWFQHGITLLMNNVEPVSGINLHQLHEWLRYLPQNTLVDLFQNLPQAQLDVLREKIFVAAFRAGDISSVRLMLKLGFDSGQAIDLGEHGNPAIETPLTHAFKHCPRYDDVAATIVKTQIHDRQQNLYCILDGAYAGYRVALGSCLYSLFEEARSLAQKLIGIILDSGIVPTYQCLALASGDIAAVERVLCSHQNGIRDMIADKLLVKTVRCAKWPPSEARPCICCSCLKKDLLTYILQEKSEDLWMIDIAKTEEALWDALIEAGKYKMIYAVDLILVTSDRLGIKLGALQYDGSTRAVLELAFRSHQWATFADTRTKYASSNMTPSTQSPQPAMLVRTITHCTCNGSHENDEAHRILENLWLHAVQGKDHMKKHYDMDDGHSGDCTLSTAGYWYYRCRKERDDSVDSRDLEEEMCRAMRFSCKTLVVAVLLSLDHENMQHSLINEILQRADVVVVGELISKHWFWKSALNSNTPQGRFHILDDILFRGRMLSEQVTFAGTVLSVYDESVKLAMHLLAYFAIYVHDEELMVWLLEMGLATIERYVACDYAGGSWSFAEVLGLLYRIPSLLSIAVMNGHTDMVRFLLDIGCGHDDSFALMRAVAYDAREEIFELLLARLTDEKAVKTGKLHVAAMRMARREGKHCLLRKILTKAAVNGIDVIEITNDKLAIEIGTVMSSLGEAILQQNVEAVYILLEHGANLNGLVTFMDHDKTGLLNSHGTIMQRASPLLAAIDQGDISMIRLLVENGADVDHGPRLGLIRTPLQRAAEIGNFEAVEYFLDMGAPVDSAPFYSGATPLQLAALGGYVGIATLLLENGADVDHLPAEGQGRTALEAAAEWSRPDMMSLLALWNVNFDLVVDNDGRTQYERALVFAEERGQMASKRFVQRLRTEALEVSLNSEYYM